MQRISNEILNDGSGSFAILIILELLSAQPLGAYGQKGTLPVFP